jgi:excisionase family DNA binding protein
MKFLTVDEVAEITRMHTNSIRRLIRQGKIKAVKRGNRWLIKESDFKKYIEG